MPEDPDEQVPLLAVGLKRGSIVAAAGCGKTEQIARAVACCVRRRLILTHTHAGVDAIVKRLNERCVSTDKYRADTIAGWCLRYATAFPKRSEIPSVPPSTMAQWNGVYSATVRLLNSGAVDGILTASYGGLFVDEYQDCTQQQHAVIRLVAERLPTCVFGDPLQSIFDFKGQQPVDWVTDVFPVFPKAHELITPWRWKKAGSDRLAEWLTAVRKALDTGQPIHLSSAPTGVQWTPLPDEPGTRQAAERTVCLAAVKAMGPDERLIVIGDGANANRRTALAEKLAKQGFSTIEPINCKDLKDAARQLDGSRGVERFATALDFVQTCMVGAERAALRRAVELRLAKGKTGPAKFADVLPLAQAVVENGTDGAVLDFMRAMYRRPGTCLYRREMFFAMLSALEMKSLRRAASLNDAVWQVQNRVRHVGRKMGSRSIGSTLLVKGLEFEHAVVVSADTMSPNDWYVALTRASKQVRVVAPTEQLTATLRTKTNQLELLFGEESGG
jgi:hypothetical protein